MKSISRTLGLALPLLTLGVLLASASLAAEQPDFSGSWKLNPELSENPREKMTEGVSKGGGGRGGGRTGGGMGEGMGGGMRGGGGSRGGDREGMQERFREREQRIQQFTIVHEEPSLQFRYGDGSETVFYTDGRITEDLETGLLDATASWKKSKRIEIQRDTPQAGAITEKYELSDDGSQLLVKIKMEGNGRSPKISFQRVYDRVPEAFQGNESDDLSGS